MLKIFMLMLHPPNTTVSGIFIHDYRFQNYCVSFNIDSARGKLLNVMKLLPEYEKYLIAATYKKSVNSKINRV